MTRCVIRYLLVLLVGFWLGGLTFYSLVVIPIGEDIVGGATQGFVTGQVTTCLNWIGAACLLALLRNVARSRERLLQGAWITMAACQAILFILHPRLDHMLDAKTLTVVDPSSFEPLHWLYVGITGLEWLGGLVCVWLLVNGTRRATPTRIGDGEALS